MYDLKVALERAKDLAEDAFNDLEYAKERGWSTNTSIYKNRLKQCRLLKELLQTDDLEEIL